MCSRKQENQIYTYVISTVIDAHLAQKRERAGGAGYAGGAGRWPPCTDCAHEGQEGGIRSPGTAVTDGSGLLNAGARNLALVLYKSHKCS